MKEYPAKLGPVTADQRIAAIDVLRGFALLGILLMNIKSYAMIPEAYFFPTAYGDLTGINLAVWWVADLFANRKFMTLFSMLFGAGVVLQARRAEEKDRPFAGFFYRRMFWLWVIGLVHAYVFWEGDILVSYALAGLLLYPMRRLKPRILLAIGLGILVLGSLLNLGAGLSAPYWDAQERADFAAGWLPSEQQIQVELDAMRGNWWQEILHRAPAVREMHLVVIPFYLYWRSLGVMLMGMALFKWGLLEGRRPAVYRVWLVLGLLVGLPLSAYGAWRQFASGWEPITAFFVDSQFGYWGSMLIALGYAGGLFLLLGTGRWVPLANRLSAVGRLALSNYLLQTVVATFIFNGRGLGFFGEVSRIGQMGVVVLIWALQLWLSPWWLARFRFGPVEWLWRSLSYWKLQPMRRA